MPDWPSDLAPAMPGLAPDLGCENLELPPRIPQIAVIALDRRYSCATTAILSDNDDLMLGLHPTVGDSTTARYGRAASFGLPPLGGFPQCVAGLSKVVPGNKYR